MSTYAERAARSNDLIAEQVVTPNYTTTSAKVKSTGAVVDFELVGQPVKVVSGVYQLVAAADIANAAGVVVESPQLVTLAANGSTEFDVAILVQGPVLLVKSKLATADFAAAAITTADYAAALAALDVSFVEEAVSGNLSA